MLRVRALPWTSITSPSTLGKRASTWSTRTAKGGRAGWAPATPAASVRTTAPRTVDRLPRIKVGPRFQVAAVRVFPPTPDQHRLVGRGLGALAHDEVDVVGKEGVVVGAHDSADPVPQVEHARSVLRPHRAALLVEPEEVERSLHGIELRRVDGDRVGEELPDRSRALQGQAVKLLVLGGGRGYDPDALLSRLSFPANLVPELLLQAPLPHLGPDPNAPPGAGDRLANRLEVAVVEERPLGHLAAIQALLEPLETGPCRPVGQFPPLEERGKGFIEQTDCLEAVLDGGGGQRQHRESEQPHSHPERQPHTHEVTIPPGPKTSKDGAPLTLPFPPSPCPLPPHTASPHWGEEKR